MKKSLLPVAAITILSGCAATPPVALNDYVVHFNEPFMTFESAGSQLLLRSPENLDGESLPVTRRQDGAAVIFSGDPTHREFTVEIEPGQCFDDMAGLEYSHVAYYTGGDYLRHRGCARLASEPQPREGA